MAARPFPLGSGRQRVGLWQPDLDLKSSDQRLGLGRMVRLYAHDVGAVDFVDPAAKATSDASSLGKAKRIAEHRRALLYSSSSGEI